MARESAALGAHPLFERSDLRSNVELAPGQALLGRAAIEVALDGEDRINAAHGLERERRLRHIGQNKEFASPMRPTRGLSDRTGLARHIVQLVESGIGVGLEKPGIL